MTKPLYFWNGTTFELVGPTTPQSPFAYQTSAPTAPATGDIWIDSDGDVDTYNRQLTRYYFVATAGQTSVSGTDANGLTLAYVAGSEAVYVNGALQVRGVDYTATNGTSITGLSALALNDVVEVFAYTAFTVANAYTKSETDSVAAAAAGLRMIVPSSVSVGSGTASANSAGYVTFSGASSLTLNGIFNTTYDNYRIIFKITSMVGGQDDLIGLQFGTNGTNNTNANYRRNLTELGTGSNVTTINATDNQSALFVGQVNVYGSIIIDVVAPFLSERTWIRGSCDTSDRAIQIATGFFDNTTSFTDVRFYKDAATSFTGTVAVYGYKD